MGVPVGDAPVKVAVKVENSSPLDPAAVASDSVMLAGNDPLLPWAQLGLHRVARITAVPVADVGPHELHRIRVAVIPPSPHARMMVTGS